MDVEITIKKRLGERAQHEVAQIVRAHIDQHYDDAVRLDRICSDLGVSVRTLQRRFQARYHLTITEYLKDVRFASAWRELRATDPTMNTVTAIALRNGFTHLGRFSTEFRQRFGHSPSAWLRTTNASDMSEPDFSLSIP